MQLSIVTIFIFLICAFSLITTLFTYYTNYKEIRDLSSIVTEQANKGVIGTVSSITRQAQLLAETAKGLISNEHDVSDKNETLISYLLNALVKEPYVYRITIATSEGNMLSATNVALSNEAHYYLNPSKALPIGSQYALRVVHRTGLNLNEIWEYKDTNMTTVETELIPSIGYDPRAESWYSNISIWPHLRWDMNYSYTLGHAGVSVSAPVVHADGKVFAVVNVDLSLHQMANILALQKIGKSGQAFVLSTSGEVLVPDVHSFSMQEGSPLLIKQAYESFVHNKEKAFLLTYANVNYLVNISDFPLDFETKWLIAVIVPFNDFFGPILETQKQAILISLVILIFFGILVYLASRYISSPIVKLAGAVKRIQNFDFEEILPIKSHISEIISLNTSIQAMRSALHSFTRYVPKEVVKTLIRQGREIDIGGERRDLTILFSDIENFTTVAESFPIEKLNLALSEYFEALSQIIVNSEGTIDKFIGDSIMAFWNAPSLVVDQGDKACLAALRCLKIVNNPHQKNVLLKGRTRFGIHSGEAIVGNIGTSERMNYTAIGNVVNTASRLQALNKIYHTSIIISETVHEKIGTRFITRPLDFIVVKGRTKGITIFELVGVREGDKELIPSPEQIELCTAFTKAYEQFHTGKINEAKAAFLALHEKFPADSVTQIYLDRL